MLGQRDPSWGEWADGVPASAARVRDWVRLSRTPVFLGLPDDNAGTDTRVLEAFAQHVVAHDHVEALHWEVALHPGSGPELAYNLGHAIQGGSEKDEEDEIRPPVPVGPKLRALIDSPIPYRHREGPPMDTDPVDLMLAGGHGDWDDAYEWVLDIYSEGDATALRLALILHPDLNVDERNDRDDKFLDTVVFRGKGSLACVAALLEAGADPSLVDDNGWSAVHTATFNGHSQCAQMLLSVKSELAELRNNEGKRPQDLVPRHDNVGL